MSDPRISDLAAINPELEKVLQNEPARPGLSADLDPVQVRAYLGAMNKIPPPNKAVDEEDRQIPMRDGTSITVRIHKPTTPPAGGSPVFVVYHGGGFTIGGLDDETLLCRDWAEHFGGVAVNVDYRLAPEHPFPVPVHDAYDALKWTAANLESLHVDPSKGFLVGGISAGANFTAVISHLYRDDKLSPPLTGLFISVPAILYPEAVPEKYKSAYLSRSQNINDPILSPGAHAFFKANYKADPFSPLSSPFLFPTGHKNLPPTYFQICGMDPNRDEALIYERVLREECGVMTRKDVYAGLPHVFWKYWPTLEYSVKHKWDSVQGLKWLLKEGKKVGAASTS